mgnify:CR=1 FL=1
MSQSHHERLGDTEDHHLLANAGLRNRTEPPVLPLQLMLGSDTMRDDYCCCSGIDTL